MTQTPADLLWVCADFNAVLGLLCRHGMRLESIYPADDPHTAILTHDGVQLRLTSRPEAPLPSADLPEFRPEFVVTRAGAASGEGRAGMHYRDLIPSRLIGRYIASHITITEGGPVDDWVHFHRIAFQLICVRRGWVRVVYQDQGDPFVMAAGDMVLQPPGIRHRVLESSAGLEVIEITCPALHETFADHEMALPNKDADAARDYAGQHFLHHVATTSPWTEWHGAQAQETKVRDTTGGLAEARIVRPGASPNIAVPSHDGELVFGFVLEGSVRLEHGEGYSLGPADCFVIPPGEAWRLTEASDDFRLLQVGTGEVTEIREGVEINTRKPEAFSDDERALFRDLVVQAGEVASAALSSNIAQAKALTMIRHRGAIRGVAALKRPQLSYRKKVSQESGIALSDEIYPYELGYVFIDPAMQGRHLSHRLVAEALEHADGMAVFATVRLDNTRMRATLKKAGFTVAGKPYVGRQKKMIGVLVKPSSK